MEQWKAIKNYEGLYEVSTLGNVRALEAKRNTGRKQKAGEKKATLQATGYMTVSLTDMKGTRKTLFLHRIMAEAFIPNPENKRCINHINSDKTCNILTNLEWATHKENTTHAIESGTFSTVFSYQKGSANPIAKLTEESVAEAREKREAGASIQSLANEYDVTYKAMYDVVNYKTWLNKEFVSKEGNTYASKLSEDDVRTIRQLHAGGTYSYQELADRYNVKYTAIYRLVKRLAWSHVE